MSNISKINIALLIGIAMLAAITYKIMSIPVPEVQEKVVGGPTAVAVTASSTKFAVTTGASVRLLATSTKRVAASVQSFNCSVGGAIYLSLTNDTPAVSNTGFGVLASTTQFFTDEDNLITGNSVQAIASAGTCDVFVTEWRSNI